ncbi:Cof-type HAD-IIB family hydrolase [Salinibacillus xinjiangensis]|uniref:Cof-type HAD-IIB family hydrolase n=1 Tax=Salinibacillus xinjiangensis TaxID=1229268 RepID=A0A6G1X8X1_9BACI|nr:Cof-type HAD-IIB family hydrolase [Salinibacillus xinjiangensis]MRG87320.1 Cof-type HAD-IIB family hydrolase [Salinibacillus xinjiangensis]
MSKKSIIFFDIDGTLLDHDKKLPESTRKAVFDLKKQGHIVAIATGRAPFLFENLMEELDIDTYVSYNGQYVVLHNEVLYRNPLNKNSIAELTDLAAQNNHPLVYMSEEMMKSNIEHHPHIEESIASLKFSHPEHDPTFHENRDLYQTLLFCTKDEEQPYENRFDDLTFMRWHEFSMDVIPEGGSKAIGIEKIVNELGIDWDNVYAFGDGMNDIEMLETIPNSVAMGNAYQPVKEVAKHVTKDVADNGIIHGLKMIGLLS